MGEDVGDREEMEVGETGEGGWVRYEGMEEDGVEEQGRYARQGGMEEGGNG